MSVVTGKTSVMEGSMAIAQAVKACRPAVISAYPITPQTHIVEALARMVADGDLDAEYVRADSEFSAASILAGASATGVRTYTASASQGLLLMTEVMYYLAGARLPVVFTGANRQISVPLGLQPEHQDSVSLRDAGVIQLYVENVQEAYDTQIQAFKIAEDHRVLLPTMVCMDGFILTHVYEPVQTFPQDAIDAFLPSYAPLHYLDPARPMVFGSYTDDANTLEFRFIVQQAILAAKQVIASVAGEYASLFGHHHGGLIDAYRSDDAEVILMAMGSTVGTLREAVDVMRANGIRVGLLKVRSFRPFPAEEIRRAVGHTGAVVVLERALSYGFQGVLAGDVKAALFDLPAGRQPLVIGTLAGLGGRDVTLDTASALVDCARRALDAGAAPGGPQFVGLRRELLPQEQC
jgi:pyruvate ferredoxin oxidoreductase alpha subunit